MKSIFKKIFLKDDKFYKVEGNDLIEIKPEELVNELEDFILIIDDSYFYYLTPEIPLKTKRKLNQILKNYLSTLFPESFIENFNYLFYKNSIIVFIINKILMELQSQYRDIFYRAEFFTTPFFIQCEKKDNFIFKDKNKIFKFLNGKIEYLDEVDIESCTTWKDSVFIDEDINYEYKIEIPGIKKGFNITENIKPFLLVASICYILFFSGMIFKMLAKKKDYQFLKDKIQKIYYKYGVASSPDPYGMLLYKASKNKKINKTNILLLLEKLSIATPENTFINNFYLKKKSFKIDGSTDGFEKIDEFKTNLEKLFKKEVIITNTIKEREWIKFRFVCK